MTAAAAVGDFPPPPRSDEEIEDPIIMDACVDGEAGMAPGVPPVERAGEGAAAAEPSVSIVKCGRLALLWFGVAILAESTMFPQQLNLSRYVKLSCPELDDCVDTFHRNIILCGNVCPAELDRKKHKRILCLNETARLSPTQVTKVNRRRVQYQY